MICQVYLLSHRGVPQIEVTFDVDANGILNVTSKEKSTGKETKITITNDKGTLSEEEITRMVEEAEKYKEEDEAKRDTVNSRNGLESYCFQLQSSLDEKTVAEKLSEEDLTSLKTEVANTMSWLENHFEEDAETYETRRKDLETLANSILSKIAGGADGGMPGGMLVGGCRVECLVGDAWWDAWWGNAWWDAWWNAWRSSDDSGQTTAPSSGGPTIEEVD